MKLIDVKICKATMQLSPEVRDYCRMVDNPQDLNEALVAVRCERAMELLAGAVQKRIEQQMIDTILYGAPPSAAADILT